MFLKKYCVTTDILERLSIAVFLQGWQVHMLDILVSPLANFQTLLQSTEAQTFIKESIVWAFWPRKKIFFLSSFKGIDM